MSQQSFFDFDAPAAPAPTVQNGGGAGASADIRTTAAKPRVILAVPATDHPTMGGKPVYEVPAKSVVNWTSDFEHKKLCTGPTFTMGSACLYRCSYCYVGSIMRKNPHLAGIDKHEDVVIRRRGAVEALRQQISARRKTDPDFADDPAQVIYSSPLVDPAGNMELVRETIEACKIILELTAWQIRLLSKSNLLPLVAAGLPEQHKHRLIFGVSTGTLDNNLARTFEEGTALVSKRLHSLHVLQDRKYRTFGMICPSLPLPSGEYVGFAQAMFKALRAERCENVWAEVLNPRGASMGRTIDALKDGGFQAEAEALDLVTHDGAAWEQYARATFEAHAPLYAPDQLRFLQYNTRETSPYWASQQPQGAILLRTHGN